MGWQAGVEELLRALNLPPIGFKKRAISPATLTIQDKEVILDHTKGSHRSCSWESAEQLGLLLGVVSMRVRKLLDTGRTSLLPADHDLTNGRVSRLIQSAQLMVGIAKQMSCSIA